jgi:hypothetical protein
MACARRPRPATPRRVPPSAFRRAQCAEKRRDVLDRRGGADRCDVARLCAVALHCRRDALDPRIERAERQPALVVHQRDRFLVAPGVVAHEIGERAERRRVDALE